MKLLNLKQNVKKLLISLGGVVIKQVPNINWDYIIAVDSGGNYLFKERLKANLLIGDLDSISNEAVDFFIKNKAIVEKFSPDKDYTDFELALMKISDFLPAVIYLNGFWGGRVDHSISNLLSLSKHCSNCLYLFETEDGCGGVCSSSKVNIFLPKNTYVSLIPLKTVYNLNSTGVKWKLRKAKLEYGEARGISNYTVENYWHIDFEEGCLCFIVMGLSCVDLEIEWFPLVAYSEVS